MRAARLLVDAPKDYAGGYAHAYGHRHRQAYGRLWVTGRAGL